MRAWVIVALVVLLAGCGTQIDTEQGSVEFKRYHMAGYSVLEFYLDDGTRCVMARSTGGVDCDWSNTMNTGWSCVESEDASGVRITYHP